MNPYLFLAAVLGLALVGIEDKLTPPAPITGNAYEQKLARRIFDDQLVDNLIRTKRQEMRHFDEISPEEQQDLYLDTV